MINKHFYKSVQGIYRIYVIPENLEDNVDSYGFNPIDDVPDWLDKVDLEYDDASNTLVTIVNGNPVHMYSGNVIVFNSRLQMVEDIQPSLEEFREQYFY